jgi:hypothetical protein
LKENAAPRGAAVEPGKRGAVPRPEWSRSWLLLVHQLPSHPSNLRVRTWRRLQQVGALAVKQAVYALPDSANAREDFEWLKTEIESAGGEASMFIADTVDTWTHDALVDEFRRLREDAYRELAREAEHVLRRLSSRRRAMKGSASRRTAQQLHERLTAIEQIDFFGSAGRDRVVALVRQVEERSSGTRLPATHPATADSTISYKARMWVTRPRPGVDRMASAWLIGHFIDPEARFGFAAERGTVPDGAIPFDMFGVEFTHHGDHCTFETLCSVFGIGNPSVARLAEIVHDLDLKDGRHGAAETATVGTVIAGLQLAHADDHELLAHGMALFDSLYRSFEHSARSTGPRVLARLRKAKNAPVERSRTARGRRA